MDLSVIIPTMNRGSDLQVALNSLLKQTAKPREVIVVDQSTDDSTKKLCQTAAVQFEAQSVKMLYVRQEKPGLTKARNNGIAASSGKILCFFDDDIELFENYLQKINEYLWTNPGVGGLSGNVLVDEQFKGLRGRIRKMIMRLFLINDFDGRMTASGFGYPVYDRRIERVIPVDILTGCNMVYRKPLLERERFDEWFTGYGYREDVDLSYRISRLAPMVMIPEAKLYHHSSPAERLSSVAKKRMEIKNNFYVFKKYKHRGPWSVALFAYSVLGLLVIDFLECVTHHDWISVQVFTTSLRAVFSLFGDNKK